MQEQYIKTTRYGTKYFKDKARTILHSEDGPAVEHATGLKEWWVSDVFIFRLNSKGEMTGRMT